MVRTRRITGGAIAGDLTNRAAEENTENEKTERLLEAWVTAACRETTIAEGT
jgi:hypothetical protein